jgi:release factor glutamine methyltransferase
MTVRQLLTTAAKKLRPKKITCPADENVGWLEAEILMAHLLNKPKEWVITHGTDVISPTLARSFQKLVARRAKHEPIAYLIGRQAFYGRTFRVNKHTLIPRPESELIIDLMKDRVREDCLFWDVGTGCGAIGITLALEFPESRVLATDTSAAALRIAEKNAGDFQADERISFLKADLLDTQVKNVITTSHVPLVVAANLPYLPDSDKKKLTPDIMKYEPGKALFAGRDANAIIKRLLLQVNEAPDINPDLMMFEFDPPSASDLESFAKETFPQAIIQIHNDLAGRNRLLEIDFRS